MSNIRFLDQVSLASFQGSTAGGGALNIYSGSVLLTNDASSLYFTGSGLSLTLLDPNSVEISIDAGFLNTGSFYYSSSVAGNIVTFYQGDGSTESITVDTGSGIEFPLSQSTGITAFTFDGQSTATVAVSGADSLNSNTVVKWTGDAFSDSVITDDGSTVTITGDLTVKGTTTTISSSNLYITDQFALFASGSTTDVDGGIIIQNSGSGQGYAFGFDASTGRWTLQKNLAGDATDMTPDAYVTTAQYGLASAFPSIPEYGGSSGYGNIWVSTDTGDIYIWA